MYMAQEVRLVSVEKLIPYARNSRTHSDAQISAVAASILEFGFTNPVLVRGDGTIVAGHGRVMAARKLGLAEVPCIDVNHMSDAQMRAYVIADNRLSDQAGWDNDLLSLELKDLLIDDYDLGSLGFDEGEIDELLREVETIGMPELPTGDKSPFQQVTFTLHDTQAEEVQRALKAAKAIGPFIDSPNANSNGNALARVCETFLTNHGDR